LGKRASSPARAGRPLRLIDVARTVAAGAQHRRLALLERVEPTVVGVGVILSTPRARPCLAAASEGECRSKHQSDRKIPHGSLLGGLLWPATPVFRRGSMSAGGIWPDLHAFRRLYSLHGFIVMAGAFRRFASGRWPRRHAGAQLPAGRHRAAFA